jgi:hypothetical protein
MVHTLVWHHINGLSFAGMATRVMAASVDKAGKEVVRVTFSRNKWNVRAGWLKQTTGIDLFAPSRRTNLGRKSAYDKATAEREQARLAACLRALTDLQVPDHSRGGRPLAPSFSLLCSRCNALPVLCRGWGCLELTG